MVRELHLPGHNYTGPFTRFKKRQQRGDKPVNRVDALSEIHDRAYEDAGGSQMKINQADVVYVGNAWNIALDGSASNRERAEAVFVAGIIGIKTVFGFALLPQITMYRKLTRS